MPRCKKCGSELNECYICEYCNDIDDKYYPAEIENEDEERRHDETE